MGTFCSGDPDEMPHDAAFHLGRHCLQGQKRSSWQENNIFWTLLPVTPQYKQWTVLTYLYKTLWKGPLICKGLKVVYNRPSLFQRFFLLDKGILYYGKNSSDVSMLIFILSIKKNSIKLGQTISSIAYITLSLLAATFVVC